MTDLSSNIFLANIGGSSLKCKVHPVVIFSILDHFLRKNEDNYRVIGTLVGNFSENYVEIKNCFPVPHIEGEEIQIDSEYHQTVLNLHRKVSPNEIVVGWYSTGNEINDASTIVQEFYSKEMGRDPLHLTVDTNLTNLEMDIKTYITSTISFQPDLVLGVQFIPISLEIQNFGSDADLIFKAKKDPISAAISDLEAIENSVDNVLQMIQIIQNYVENVKNGKISPDTKIGRILAVALSNIPKWDAQSVEKMFTTNLQDLLMVVYLANLTRAQLRIAERVTQVL